MAGGLKAARTRVEDEILTRSLWSVLNGTPLPFDAVLPRVHPPAELERCLLHLARSGAVEIDRFGRRVIGALGITLVRTPHEFLMWRRGVYAHSCAHALAIFASLNESGTVWSRCSECGRRITITIASGRIERVRPRRHSGLCLMRLEATKTRTFPVIFDTPFGKPV